MATKTAKKAVKEVKEEKSVRSATPARNDVVISGRHNVAGGAAKETKEEKGAEVYFYGVGRRKASIAKVKIFVSDKGEEAIINKRKLKEYFPTLGMQNNFAAPLRAVDSIGKFRIEISVSGGGKRGQLGASILGMARALVVFNPELKKLLKAEKLMTRDSRVVERKKPGLKKARKSPQWAKR